MGSTKPSDFGVLCHLIQPTQPHIRFMLVLPWAQSKGQYRSLQSRLLQCLNYFKPPFDTSMNSVHRSSGRALRLANASGVTPCIRAFHSPGVLSVEKTFIFAIQGAHTAFAIGGVSYSADSFVVIKGSPDSYRDRINICAEKPAHRKSANR